jgi:hypothetical protein
MFFIIVDKAKARAAGWDDIKIYKDTTAFLIRNFLLILLTSDSRGEIIIESSSASKDVHLIDSLNFFLGAGIAKLGIDYNKVQDTLTSVSFVTKKNHDIEEQIADLFAYAAKIKYQSSITKNKSKNDYEKMITNLLGKKIFSAPVGAGLKKAKLFKEVEPFLVLP